MKKTLIVYASKTGTTQDAANSLASTLAPLCDTYDCRRKEIKPNSCAPEALEAGDLPWVDYEVVVLGTAMYIGKPMKEFMNFCKAQETELLKKKLLLFTCGVGTQEEDKRYLWQCLPNSITHKALLYCHLGGEIREDRMSLFNRMAMRAYVKQHGEAPGVNQGLVDEISHTVKNSLLK